jgi:hypothetical protein
VEERGGQRSGIEAHVGEDVGDLEEMHEVGLAGFAKLGAMALGSDFVGAANHPGVFGGAMLAQLGEKFLEADVELALGAVAVEAERNVTRRRHSLVYDRRKEGVSRGAFGVAVWYRQVTLREFERLAIFCFEATVPNWEAMGVYPRYFSRSV